MDADKLAKLKALQGTSPQQGQNGLKTPVQAVSGHPGDYQSLKDRQIARSVALNNAAILTQAYAHIIAATDMVKGMGEKEVKGWLKSMKISEYAENLKLLTGEDAEIPF